MHTTPAPGPEHIVVAGICASQSSEVIGTIQVTTRELVVTVLPSEGSQPQWREFIEELNGYIKPRAVVFWPDRTIRVSRKLAAQVKEDDDGDDELSKLIGERSNGCLQVEYDEEGMHCALLAQMDVWRDIDRPTVSDEELLESLEPFLRQD